MPTPWVHSLDFHMLNTLHVKGNGRRSATPKPLDTLLWLHLESYHYPDFRIQRLVHYINGLQQYAQKFGLSLILCLWYWFILSMSNISRSVIIFHCENMQWYILLLMRFGKFFNLATVSDTAVNILGLVFWGTCMEFLGPQVAWILPAEFSKVVSVHWLILCWDSQVLWSSAGLGMSVLPTFAVLVGL